MLHEPGVRPPRVHVVAIIDLGSAVGTKVNGELVARQALRVDDVIAVGGTTIRVVAIAAAR